MDSRRVRQALFAAAVGGADQVEHALPQIRLAQRIGPLANVAGAPADHGHDVGEGGVATEQGQVRAEARLAVRALCGRTTRPGVEHDQHCQQGQQQKIHFHNSLLWIIHEHLRSSSVPFKRTPEAIRGCHDSARHPLGFL